MVVSPDRCPRPMARAGAAAIYMRFVMYIPARLLRYAELGPSRIAAGLGKLGVR
eukprot:SAG31_NODE_849_length_11529_cov_3.342257_1_plen_54_part_00